MRQHPRISILKLAEYMGANGRRRRRIVKDQHDPPDFIVKNYRRADAAAVSFFRREKDIEVLDLAIEKLESTEPKSDNDAQDIVNSALGLHHLRACHGDIAIGTRIMRGRRRGASMWMRGVEVSSFPHARVARQWRGEWRVGVVKLRWGKTRPLGDEEGAYAAALLRHFAEELINDAGLELAVTPGLCQVVDVFRQKVFVSPKHTALIIREAEACCDEIASSWPGQPRDQSIPPSPYV